MALGALTLTITIDSVDKVLKRVNQDNYATRYYLREATQEFVVLVRHSKERKNGVLYEVHNVEFINEVFATLTAPARVRSTWTTIRNVKEDDYAAVEANAIALADLLKVTGNVDDLLSWVG